MPPEESPSPEAQQYDCVRQALADEFRRHGTINDAFKPVLASDQRSFSTGDLADAIEQRTPIGTETTEASLGMAIGELTEIHSPQQREDFRQKLEQMLQRLREQLDRRHGAALEEEDPAVMAKLNEEERILLRALSGWQFLQEPNRTIFEHDGQRYTAAEIRTHIILHTDVGRAFGTAVRSKVLMAMEQPPPTEEMMKRQRAIIQERMRIALEVIDAHLCPPSQESGQTSVASSESSVSSVSSES